MLVKLTYSGTNRNTLVNLTHVVNAYPTINTSTGKTNTKILLAHLDKPIYVEETLKEMYELQRQVITGEYDTSEFIEPEPVMDFEPVDTFNRRSVENQLESGFNRNRSYERNENYNRVNNNGYRNRY